MGKPLERNQCNTESKHLWVSATWHPLLWGTAPVTLWSCGPGHAASLSTLPFPTFLAQAIIVPFCLSHNDWARHDLVTQVWSIKILPWDIFNLQFEWAAGLHFESKLKLFKGYLLNQRDWDPSAVEEKKPNSPKPRCRLEGKSSVRLWAPEPRCSRG